LLLWERGFSVIRIKGSHRFLRHEDGRSTVVLAHPGEIIGPG
jgi:predicted RNA binding protein YcfA (HicA-like mRNA interferase family)